MSELCKANPCCGEFYGKCKIPIPQDLSGFWNLNNEEQKKEVLEERSRKS